MKKILKNIRGVTVFGCITINTIICFVPIFVLAMIKLLIPVAVVRREISKVLMAIGEFWISVNTLILCSLGSIDWKATGHEHLERDAWYLLIANHQTWIDIVVLQKVFNRRIPFLKFFIKQELIWFPLLGIAWWALDMPFMKRYSKSYIAKYPHKKGMDLEATRRACAKFKDTPTTVINFIEGTRFSEQKHAARGAVFENLLPPRAGGVALAMASMGQLFNSVLDVTLVYPNGPANFWDMCCGEHVEVIVDVLPRPIEAELVSGDYENDRECRREFHRWLTDIWQEKDQRITTIKAQAKQEANA